MSERTIVVSNVYYDEPATCYVCGEDMDETEGFQVVTLGANTARLVDVCSQVCVTDHTEQVTP